MELHTKSETFLLQVNALMSAPNKQSDKITLIILSVLTDLYVQFHLLDPHSC